MKIGDYKIERGYKIPRRMIRVRDIKDRFESKFIPEPNSGCWIWMDFLNRLGYGQFFLRGKVFRAHRFSYEMYCGPIPDGLELDHTCRMRCCVNPDHLEPVTHAINVRRRVMPLVTHCPSGHEYDEANTAFYDGGRGGYRYCRECKRLKIKAYRASKR